jgi:hypothetical protein
LAVQEPTRGLRSLVKPIDDAAVYKVPIFKEIVEELLNYKPSGHEDDWTMYNYLSAQASLKELINRYKSD